jgi:phosphoserine aminotransferase
MSQRIFNFAAGPAVLPESVLREAQRDIWDIDGSGIGILEHSHRGKVFDRVIAQAEADCRSLGRIPDTHRVLFLQGGASSQFFMVPANLLPPGGTADYINTGVWATNAIREAKHYGEVHVAGSAESEKFSRIPAPGEIRWSQRPAYAHYTSNNTIYGTQWTSPPQPPAGVPVVCDMSSDFFSRPIDFSKHALVYAGAQKNVGPAGLTVVIIRSDLVEKPARDLPAMQRYATHAQNDSRYNTPPTFGIYLAGRTFQWLLSQGGLEGIDAINRAKAKVIYDAIDASDGFYRGAAAPESRSLMNITFRLPGEDLEAKFVKEAAAQGMDGLKGHRSVGGVRASIYNAFPRAGCDALAQFMREFQRRSG